MERQIAQFAASEAQPSHRGLQIEASMPYAQEIAGREIASGLDQDIAAVRRPGRRAGAGADRNQT